MEAIYVEPTSVPELFRTGRRMKRLPRPDDDDKPFIVRWNTLCRILLVESSVKLVARTAVDFADFNDGSSCFPSNERIVRETGYSEKTVRFAWAVMRGLGMAERVADAVSYRRIAAEYQLSIPAGWRSMPILGPRAGMFTCLGCGKPFAPQGNCSVNDQPGDKPGTDVVRFSVWRMTFCPEPRARKGRNAEGCRTLWDKARIAAGEPVWRDLDGDEPWRLFREARGDDW